MNTIYYFSGTGNRRSGSSCQKTSPKNRQIDECTGCALWAKICTLSNISMEDNKPVYGNNCQLCEECYNICPEQVISLGKTKLENQQFRHPGISVSRISSQKINIKKTSVDLSKM